MPTDTWGICRRGCRCIRCRPAASAPSTEVRDEPGAACKCFPANDRCPSAVIGSCQQTGASGPHGLDRPTAEPSRRANGWDASEGNGEDVGAAGHPAYVGLLDELRVLHKTKSAGYGTGTDPMGNFTAVAELAGQPRYLYPVHRTIEKLTRVLSLHAQGRTDELEEEFLDGASLLLCAAAMLRDDRPAR